MIRKRSVFFYCKTPGFLEAFLLDAFTNCNLSAISTKPMQSAVKDEILCNLIFHIVYAGTYSYCERAHSFHAEGKGILINDRGTVPGTDVVSTGSLTMSK